jgi:hypothetical protein
MMAMRERLCAREGKQTEIASAETNRAVALSASGPTVSS